MDTEECHWIDSCPASDDCPLGWVGDCTNDDLTTNVPTTTDGTTSQTTTTPAQSTTEAITSAVVVSAKEWLPLLISKIETVFEDNRPGKILPKTFSKDIKLFPAMAVNSLKRIRIKT